MSSRVLDTWKFGMPCLEGAVGAAARVGRDFFGFRWERLVNYLANRLTGFKLLGIPYLVGKISRSNFYFRVHWLSEWYFLEV